VETNVRVEVHVRWIRELISLDCCSSEAGGRGKRCTQVRRSRTEQLASGPLAANQSVSTTVAEHWASSIECDEPHRSHGQQEGSQCVAGRVRTAVQKKKDDKRPTKQQSQAETQQEDSGSHCTCMLVAALSRVAGWQPRRPPSGPNEATSVPVRISLVDIDRIRACAYGSARR
jgi:hypothetical protein